MATKTKQPTLIAANLTFDQMRHAILKIDRRLSELETLESGLDSITDEDDPGLRALGSSLEALITSIYGCETVEYDRYHWSVSRLSPTSTWPDMTVHDIRDQVRSNVKRSKALLEGIKRGFQEELTDAGESASGKAMQVYEGMRLHPDIERAVGRLFRDGHYANAIQDAVKALNQLVRLKSGIDDKDGDPLMKHVFSPNNPILRFNDLLDESDRNEQKGFMDLFSGTVSGLRNPRAHKIIRDEPERALEFIAFISLLAKLVDEAKKTA
jgi:uncharacterized protein (TIGR02391 family)